MADQPVTIEKLINADKDVQTIEDFIKKPKNETVTTRFGDEIMTLKGLEEEAKKSGGYFKRYTSLAAANADIDNIPVNSVVKVTDAVDGGDYEKAAAGATSLTKSQYDQLEQSISYTDEKVNGLDSRIKKESFDESAYLYKFIDSSENIIGYVLNDGQIFWSGLKDSIQAHINSLVSKVSEGIGDDFHLLDDVGNRVFSILSNGEVYIPLLEKSLQETILNRDDVESFDSDFPNPGFLINYVDLNANTVGEPKERLESFKLKVKSENIKKIKGVSAKYGREGTTIQRIPALLKLSETKVLMLFNSGMHGYDGDATGAKMYQQTITINSGELSFSDIKLFHQVNDLYPAGVVKHAQLCKLSDNRVCCLFEVNAQSSFKYKQYVCYSSDDGETWTNPVEVIFNNANGSDSITWSTDSKTLVLGSGRLIQAIYLRNQHKVASAYSDDNGLTWTLSPYIQSPTGTWHTESTFVQLPDGTIKFWFRDESNPGFKRIYISSDDGETLTYAGNANFSCPPCQASSVIFEDGVIVLATPTNPNNRNKFRLMFSFDDGETFPIKTILAEDLNFFAYSSLIKINETTLLCAVEGNWGSGAVSTNTSEDLGVFLINLSGAFKYGFNS
ncbi:sialidase family protein [Acinetobacter variabilis]